MLKNLKSNIQKNALVLIRRESSKEMSASARGKFDVSRLKKKDQSRQTYIIDIKKKHLKFY